MKTLQILLQVGKHYLEEMTQKILAIKVLKYVLFFFLLSTATLLTSCVVGYETPVYAYGGIGAGHSGFGMYVDPWDYGWRRGHPEWIRQHPHWRHEYRGYHGGHYRGGRRR